MITGLSQAGTPLQQRITPNEGVTTRGNQINVDEKTATDKQFDLKEVHQNDPKQKEKVKEVIKGLNDFLEPSHTSIKFKLHEKLHEYYVTIVDDSTNEVVKEIPSKKLLDMYADMSERLGILVDKKI